jgi:cobalt-zinc-cadmium resistance protein CzcA
MGSITVHAPDGSTVPLREVADVTIREGAAQIRREALSRRIAVKCNVRGRDLGGFVREAMDRVRAATAQRWDPDYVVRWEGEYENQKSATARLRLIVPTCGVLVFALLYLTFRSLRTATLILATIPLALVGGVFGLAVMGIYLSVSSAIGFITLAGVAVQNAIILVARIHTLRDHDGLALEPAIVRGATERLRPVLITALTAALGFAPSVASHGIGAEVRRPLATVVVFGILGATAFTLVVLPCLYRLFERAPVKAPGLIE